MKSLTDKRPASESNFNVDQLGKEVRILEDGDSSTLFTMVDQESQRIILVQFKKGTETQI